MKPHWSWIWKLSLLIVCFLGCVLISIAPRLLLPDDRLGIVSLSDPSAWQIHLGDLDSPPSSLSQAASGWLQLQEHKQDSYIGTYWLKRTIPASPSQEPYLWVQHQNDFEMYVDGNRYSCPDAGCSDPLVRFFQLHLVPLPADASGKELYIRSHTAGSEPLLGSFQLGSQAALQQSLLVHDTVKLGLFVIYAALGLISLCLYALNRKERAYFYFSLFTLDLAYLSWMHSYIPHTLADLSWMYRLKDLPAPVSLFTLLGFQETIFEKGAYVTYMARLRRVMLGFTLVCLAAAFSYAPLYELLITDVQMFLYIIILLVGIYGVVKHANSNVPQRRREVNLLVFGFANMSAFTFIHFILMLRTSFTAQIKQVIPSAYWGYDQALVGCLLFVLCLGLILLFRFTDTYKQVKQYAQQLESKNQELQALDRLKDDFLAKTSHELRTPIHGMIGITESLLDGTVGRIDEIAKRQLALVVYSGQRLTHLINDILDHSKLKHRAMDLSVKRVGIKQVADIALTVLRPQADKKGLAMLNEIEDSLPDAAADEDRIEQVLINLLANAVKFTDKGHIRISAARSDDMVVISVSDTGIGIQEQHLATIFEPFDQAEQTITRDYGGTGLGLTICKQLIEMHGGRIYALSEPDKGSTFSFTLPLWKEELPELPQSASNAAARTLPFLEDEDFRPAPIAEAKTAAETEAADKPTILAVDDEMVNLEVIAAHLASDYHVVKARHASEALQWIERNGIPDLIISDVMMPKMTGYDLSSRIRKQHNPGELPILLLSAKNQTSDIVGGFDAGINDYLSKPVAKRELLARVRLHLQLSRLNRSLEDQVQQRTEQLEQTYRQLQLSLQETFKAMGEVTIWEERNRIAHEIHDILGHKLTGTIVQLEAAKLLMSRNPQTALQKLELAQDAVRKGLHDIREAVHQVRDDLKKADLNVSLRTLIKETEEISGVTVQCEIGTLPALNALQKKVIYHALQEGLTNGIKHAGSELFHFSLYHAEGWLHFSLVNDGRPYAGHPRGFGLTAMADKVQHLGGTTSLRALPQQGSELCIAIPCGS